MVKCPSETDNFTVITDGVNTKLVINYQSTNSNRVTIPVTTSECSDIENISLNQCIQRGFECD